jgi:hypothetical protein
MSHKVYASLVSVIRDGKLREPFSNKDFRAACPGLGEGTYNAFLDKHARGNPGKNLELFIRTSPGKFECLRPFKYGLDE